MRILAIAPTPFFADRGCHIRIYEQMKVLRDRGHDIRIIAYGQGRDVKTLEIERIKSIWNNDPLFGQSLCKRIILDFLMIFKTVRIKKKFNPDIIHCYLHNGFLIGYISSFFNSKKIIFDCQGSLASEIQENGLIEHKLMLNIIKIVEKFIYKKTLLILVSSGAIKDEIKKDYNIPGSKILVVKDGPIKTNDKIDKEKIKEYKNKMGVPAGYKTIIYTGILSDSEGIGLLLKTINLLKEQTSNFLMVIAGYPNIEKYEKLSKEYKIDKITKFLGKIDYFELPHYLAAADIAVAPKISQTEAHGKIINYLAVGLPVVCFKSKTNYEIAEQYAIYADEKTPLHLSQALEIALNDDKFRDKKSEIIRFVEQQYNWDGIISVIERAYQDILEYGTMSCLR